MRQPATLEPSQSIIAPYTGAAYAERYIVACQVVIANYRLTGACLSVGYLASHCRLTVLKQALELVLAGTPIELGAGT